MITIIDPNAAAAAIDLTGLDSPCLEIRLMSEDRVRKAIAQTVASAIEQAAGVTIKFCAHDGVAFRVGGATPEVRKALGTSRTDRDYCSDSCRLAAAHARKSDV